MLARTSHRGLTFVPWSRSQFGDYTFGKATLDTGKRLRGAADTVVTAVERN
jgi:hypothetical protein